jgi:site-specific DNA-methyltransferase (adenine-specific)
MMAKKQPLRNHEQVLVFYKNQPTYNPQPTKKNTKGMHSKKYEKIERGTESYGDAKLVFNNNLSKFGYPMTILNEITMENNLNMPKSELGLHPTQKPKGLFEYLIKTYTNEGDLVLDNCAGSGTTGVACINTKRNFILIEKEPKYIEIIKERIKNTQEPLI